MAYAFLYESQTYSLTQTIKNKPNYYVDQLSDVDSSADKGTHSNFTAQKYGPDSVYDTLTEGYTGNPITFRSSATQKSQDSLTIIKPAGTVENDVMLANIYAVGASTPTITPPSGWTLIISTVGSASNSRLSTYYKVAGASEPANYQWTFSGGQTNQGGISTYYGVNTADPIDVYGGQANTASISYTAPSVTTTVANTTLVAGFGALAGGSDNTVTPPSGMTECYDVGQDNDGPACLESADVVQASAGASGTKVATGQSGTNIGHLVALKPTPNYQLDLEVQWTSADFHEANEELCIYGGTMGSESLRVDVWAGSSWQNVISSLSTGWNNVTVSAYLVSSTFTIRFNGSLETADDTQDSWAIDATVLHLWS
jgi:hypothetical protein